MPLRQLYPDPLAKDNPPREVDIIAVHGLNPKSKKVADHAEHTWSKGDRLWLRDDLPKHAPNARIFLYEYNSAAIYGGDYGSFMDKANAFLQDALIERKGAEDVPLILLGHSLGGLLIEQALVNAAISSNYSSIREATVGVAFFGTPHSGGKKALVALGSVAANITHEFGLQKGGRLLETLKTDSTFTDILQNHWRSQSNKLKIISFWGNKDEVVPKESSSFGFPDDRETVVMLDAGHRNVCKFDQSQGDQGNLKRVMYYLENLYEEAVSRKPPTAKAQDYTDDEPYQKCLYTLYGTNPSDDMARIQETKDTYLEGTCSWILNDPVYKSFIEEERSQILWIHGDPGKGKTMLAISQVQYIQDRVKNASDTQCYFFCDNKDDRKSSAVSVLQSVLHQILSQHPEAFEIFRHEWIVHKEKLFSGPNAQQSLWRVLENVLSSLTGEITWLVIDALDECELNSREILLQRIISRIKTVESIGRRPNERWILTSRNEPPIRQILEGCKEISLEFNAESVNIDVQRFIDKKVEMLAQKKKYRTELKEQISKSLREQAEGTFLWVSLACTELRKMPSFKALQVLQRLPSDLNKLYEQLLNVALRDEEDANLVRGILVSVIVAYRPLTLYELALLASLPEEDHDDKETIQQYVELCGSFVTIRHGSIHLVHQSAKEFLASSQMLPLSVRFAEEHKLMTIRCLDYICSGIFDNGGYKITSGYLESTREIDSALADFQIESKDETLSSQHHRSDECAPIPLTYPILSWPMHAKLASPDIEEYFERRKEFFTPASKTRAAWYSTYSLADVSFEYEVPDTPMLHLAANMGVMPLVAKILKWKLYPIDLKDHRHQTALGLAADEGEEEVVRLLLSKGANVNAYNNEKEENRSPLNRAIRGGYVNVVRILLESKADTTGRYRGTGQYGGSALHLAAEYGQEEIVHLLLEHGADVSGRTVTHFTPLHVAVRHGHFHVVRLLLDWGADTSAAIIRELDGLTALHMATKAGYEKAVSLLLDNGADANLKCRKGLTALYMASQSGYEKIFSLLLNNGADVNCKSEYGETLLSMAAETGQEKVVSLLLNKGADVNLKSFQGKTALHRAAQGGYEKIVSLLLNNSADVNAKDTGELTALHVATKEQVVSLLLNKGADVNLKSIQGGTALHRAAQGGSEKVVSLLLKNGADVDSRHNKNGGTALHAAAAKGRKESIILLLDHGADVSLRSNLDRTVLHYASSRDGSDAVVKLLLERGVSVNIEDSRGHTALHIARHGASEAIIQHLLEYGAIETECNSKCSIFIRSAHLTWEEGREAWQKRQNQGQSERAENE